MIPIIEVATVITWKVTKGMGDRIVIKTEGEILEARITIGIGVGHMKGRTQTEGMVKV